MKKTYKLQFIDSDCIAENPEIMNIYKTNTPLAAFIYCIYLYKKTLKQHVHLFLNIIITITLLNVDIVLLIYE